jgi:GH15 family glucan-1,4-alpha-glucosidase
MAVQIAGAIALALVGVAQVNPFASFRELTSSNGFAPIVYDAQARKIVSFRENLYRFPAPGQQTRELAFDLYLGLRVNGQGAWLKDVPLTAASYEVGTNLIRTVQEDRGIRVTTTYFAPFDLPARAFVLVARLENVGADASDVALFSLHNFHTGGGPNQTSAERIVWDADLGAYLESSMSAGAPAGVLIAKPLTPATHHTASPANPYPLVTMNALFGDVDDSGVFDDAVSGFELDVAGRGAFIHGAAAEFAIAIGWAPDMDARALATAISAFAADRTPSEILDRERASWRDWHAAGLPPHPASPAEDRVVRQSLAILRMAEVAESGPPNGAVVASIPPGYWDIDWLRDSMLAVEAFERTGHRSEAEAALEFAIRGPVGAYQAYVGRPYGLSVARYFGDGAEDSDSNADGPNIELDGFGMYLGAAALHARSSPAWFSGRRAAIDALVADVLVAYRDPETRLIAPDSSIWETHWDNGGRQRWASTSGMAVFGLEAWAGAIEAIAGAQDPQIAVYRASADEIRAAIRTHLVDPTTHALAASVEQLRNGDGKFADAQTALVIDADVITATGAIGLATLDLLRSKLFLGATGHGYKRNDDGGAYDEREWIVIDLAISRALRKAGRTREADALLDWVTSEADLNGGLLPELLDENDASYLGAIPMVGFGAAAYLLALLERSPAAVPGDGGSADAAVGADALAGDASGGQEVGDGVESSADAGGAEDAPRADAERAKAIMQSSCACRGARAAGSDSELGCLTVALSFCLRLARRWRWGRFVKRESDPPNGRD